jgi:peroxiredoxin
MPDEGSPAPDFTLPDQDGNDVSLAHDDVVLKALAEL